MNQFRTSRELKAIVREQLLGNYQTAIKAYFIMQLIISGSLSFVESQTNLKSVASSAIYWSVYFILLLLSAVFTVGQYRIYRNLLEGRTITVKDMWFGFSFHPDKAIMVNFLLFLLYLILSIPFLISCTAFVMTKNGFVFLFAAICLILYMILVIRIGLAFSQAHFLLMDYPEETASELLKHSARIMEGHKGQFFYLMISFIGIWILVLCTFGIGILWAYPYITGSRTAFYEELRLREPAKHIDVVIQDAKETPSSSQTNDHLF